MNHRHLNAKASVADIAIEVENDQRETARKLAQAHGLASKTVHATGSPAFKEVGQVGDQCAGRGYEEGAIENMRGNHGDDRFGFFTIWDNDLNVGGSAEGEE